nr:hypothetical protein [Tanacetum cinerariifolium]
MHNNIMAAGLGDRPPMLAIGRYPQWQSRFLQYIDTRPNGDALRKCILSGPYKPTTILAKAQVMSSPARERNHKYKYPPLHHGEVGKEIAKPITPLSETASEENSDPEQAQRDRDMQKNLALIAKYLKKIYKPTNNNLKTSSNSRNKNVDTTSWYKNANQSGQFRNQMTVNVFGARENEKMLLCKQDEKGVPLQAEQYDWLADTDEEIDEQELKAHYSYMEKIQEVPTTDTCTDSEPLEQTEFEKYKAFNDRIFNYDKLKQIVDNAWIKHSKDQFRAPTTQDMEILIQTCLMPLALKTQNDSFIFVHELKQEMHVDLKYVESLEKEIDELESDKAKFSDMYDMICEVLTQ